MTPSDFQEAVWSHVRQIPPGKVTTYGNIAKALGKPVETALAAGRLQTSGLGCSCSAIRARSSSVRLG